MLTLPYLAYITVDLNPADWTAPVAQLAEHWTSNPVVMGLNPVRGSSVFFSLSAFGLCLTCFPCFPCLISIYLYEIDHVCTTWFYMWVIPNHFNKSFYMTLSELDETWYVRSTCGFVKTDKVSYLVALWLPS